MYVLLSALMLAWDILLAGRIAQLRRLPPRFVLITALAGLLVAPAALVSVAASSTLYGRALQPVAWVWPFTTLLFLLQALYATSRGHVRATFGVPIVLYDLVIAAVAISKYIALRGGTPPAAVLALSAAQASAAGIIFGAPALWKTYIQIPLLAPALPAHWRATAFARVVLGAIATLMTGFVLVQVPNGIAAVRSYSRYASQRMQERPQGDMALGLKIFPDLTAPPTALAVRSDSALIRQLDLRVIAVVVRPGAVRSSVLDSLARTLDQILDDTSTLVVSLGYPDHADELIRRAPQAYIRARVREIDRLTRWLKPDIIVPAIEPYGEGARAAGLLAPAFWEEYLRAAAAAVKRVRPATRVGVAAASYGARDSTLYTWASAPGSPIDVLGFSLFPGFDGAATLDTRMRIAQRWLRAQGDHPKPHWIFATGGYPGAHGERSQELAIWGVAAWATAQPAIRGVLLYEAGDYDTMRGLRAPDRRLRPAAAAVERLQRGLREARQ